LTHTHFDRALTALRQHTAIVIPVYLPADVDNALGARLLRDNLRLCLQQLDRPQSICLSVDGPDNGLQAAQTLAAELGVQVSCTEYNGGKLWALRHGMAQMFQQEAFTYFAAIDADGDHFGNELPNFIRAAEHVRQTHAEVLVLGRRQSLHRPLGFLRGEMEELADRVLLDALAYDAAHSGTPLPLEYATALEEVPDFHSGYKVFSRAATQAVFLDPPQTCGLETAYYRHGVEAVMTVEALKAGACLAIVNRSTYNEQPMSTFGLLNRSRLVADKMIWPCKRLQIPAPFIDQWLRNHIPRLLLNTLAPQGQQEVEQIRRLVLEAFDLPYEEGDRPMGPLFV